MCRGHYHQCLLADKTDEGTTIDREKPRVSWRGDAVADADGDFFTDDAGAERAIEAAVRQFPVSD